MDSSLSASAPIDARATRRRADLRARHVDDRKEASRRRTPVEAQVM
jgi:hypothetical protein